MEKRTNALMDAWQCCTLNNLGTYLSFFSCSHDDNCCLSSFLLKMCGSLDFALSYCKQNSEGYDVFYLVFNLSQTLSLSYTYLGNFIIQLVESTTSHRVSQNILVLQKSTSIYFCHLYSITRYRCSFWKIPVRYQCTLYSNSIRLQSVYHLSCQTTLP